MKVVHLTVARQLTPGQSKQLRFEHDAAKRLESAEWTTLAYHNGLLTEPYMRRIPAPFRSLFMRKLWGWLVALKLSRTHDVVMMRHMTFDPFVFFFAPLIPNRVSVHHAKEVEELRLIRKGWKGRVAAWLERSGGGFAVRRTKMILGVTQEIAEYEKTTRAPRKKIGIYPNGVDVAQVSLLDDERIPGEIHIAFICGTFSEWHGLDKLIEAVDAHDFRSNEQHLTIHLIGRLSERQLEQLSATVDRARCFQCHGLLDADFYRPILNQCDFGVASLALNRQNLSEASTLKVREMLAMGLAIYSGHRDVALPEDEDFVKITSLPTISELTDFAIQVKKIERTLVRERSIDRIDKMKGLLAVTRSFKDLDN